MFIIEDDQHYKAFGQALDRARQKYGSVPEEDLLKQQKRQVERLVALEKEFRQILIKHPWGASVYRSFISYICDERRNELEARPFFRERAKVFTSQISKALEKRHDKKLYKFHFNWKFITFVLKSRKWPKGGKLVKLAKEIQLIRNEIVEMNLPLAISRACIFWRKTPKGQLSFMDLIQITSEGLLAAVDKFCLPFSRVFRSVIIGRCTGNLIKSYSETHLHFYPVDKRKIYRANKLMRLFQNGEVDFDKLTDMVNDGIEKQHQTTPAELSNLLAAASCVSTDSSAPNDPEEGSVLDTFVAEKSVQPDAQFETFQAQHVMFQAVGELSILEKKLLRLKGLAL